MRAYVITDRIAEDREDSTNIVGVTSSKKSAIGACEEFLGRTGEQGVIKWKRKDKHSGYAVMGDHQVSYKMFFVNQIDE
jgi:hypothetical protein